MANIIMIDDDIEVIGINKKYLEGCGFEVFGTDSPSEGIEKMKDDPADIIILDVMMPEMDGFEVCRKIREFSDVPIIFLTGKSDEDDKLNALMLGGDDYILKPYSLKELKVRIEVILRRVGKTASKAEGQDASDSKTQSESEEFLVIGKLKIDRLNHRVFFDDKEYVFTKREYAAFVYMAENPNRTVTFKELGTQIFGTYLDLDRQAIMVIVSRVRKKIGEDPDFAEMIESRYGKGYSLVFE